MKLERESLQREVRRFVGVFIGSALYMGFGVTFNVMASSTEQALVSPLSDKNLASELVSNIKGENEQNEVEKIQEVGCNVANTFTSEVLRWEEDICRWSKEHQMDPDLIATIMQIESCGNHLAVSATGVRGLFQVTGANLDGEDPFDPNVSMAKGPGKVLKNELNQANNHVVAALAGYNGGGYAREYIKGDITQSEFYWYLRRHASGYWRSEPKARAKINEVEYYAKWANIFMESKEGRGETLQAWLDKGGLRLCESAQRVQVPNQSSLLTNLQQ